MTQTNLDNLFRLDGKVVVITGAGGLLGRKHAEAVAAYGGIPVLLDLYHEPVESLATELNQQYSVNAVAKQVDITDEQQIADLAAWLDETYDSVHGLINNAANNPKVEESKDKNFSRLENFPLEVWNLDMAVGITGSFLCAKHIGALIAKNPEGGSIINVSSDLGVMAPDQRLYQQDGLPEALQPVKPVTYSVVKSAIIGLTRYLATYWSEKGVRCNAICPGGVENGQPEAFLAKVNACIPMGRMAHSDEYQGTIVWMLGNGASYLNGSIVSVDGGRTVW